MSRTILVPVDFSPNSLKALDYAVKLAVKLKAKIELLHIYLVPSSEKNTMLGAILYGDTNVKAAAEKKLFQLAKKYSGDLKLTYSLVDGVAAVSIVERAKQLKAEIIVIGKTGKGALQRFLVGSTTAQVIKRAMCKVLVIPPSSKFRSFKNIVFATDLKNDNLKFVRSVVSFARSFDAQITFLYVDNRFMIHSDDEIISITNKIRSKTGYKKISGYVCSETNTKEGIHYFLGHKKADLLAVVSRHHSYPAALWSKSVSQKISNNIKIPMLVFEKIK